MLCKFCFKNSSENIMCPQVTAADIYKLRRTQKLFELVNIFIEGRGGDELLHNHSALEFVGGHNLVLEIDQQVSRHNTATATVTATITAAITAAIAAAVTAVEPEPNRVIALQFVFVLGSHLKDRNEAQAAESTVLICVLRGGGQSSGSEDIGACVRQQRERGDVPIQQQQQVSQTGGALLFLHRV